MPGETLARGLLADGAAATAAPFPHVVCRPALAEGDYRRLAETFPPIERIAGPPPYPNNEAFRVGAATMLRSRKLPEVWRDFVAHHVSPAFWSDVARVLGDGIRALHPTAEARVGRPLDQWRVGCRKRDQGMDLLLDCQLVVNTPVTAETTVRGAHIDTPDKIVSGLYYFRPDDDATPGGDLDLYRWRGPPRFHDLFAPGDAVEKAATVPYAANTFLAFVNAPVSVHGVSRRTVTDRPRFYVNFIAELPFDLFTVPQAPGWRPAPDDREAPPTEAAP